MTRWFFVWLLGGAGLLSAIPPNIIVFMVDDYDKYETSVYGGKVLTPNLDRLAREGITLKRARHQHGLYAVTLHIPDWPICGVAYSAEFLELFPKGQQSLPGFNVELEPTIKTLRRCWLRPGTPRAWWGNFM